MQDAHKESALEEAEAGMRSQNIRNTKTIIQEQESPEMKEAQAGNQEEDQDTEMDLNRRKAQVSQTDQSGNWVEWRCGFLRGGKIFVEMFGIQSKCLCLGEGAVLNV